MEGHFGPFLFGRACAQPALTHQRDAAVLDPCQYDCDMVGSLCAHGMYVACKNKQHREARQPRGY